MRGEYTPEQVARFWSKVRKTDTCWLWTDAPMKSGGYGVIRLSDGHYVRAHRFSYELAYGPIPAGLLACHKCDVPLCVRPDHLWLGTHADNSADMAAKGRSTWGDRNPSRLYPERRATGDRQGLRLHPEKVRRGEQSSTAKLTEAAVRDIRSRYAAGGVTQQALADQYGVNNSLICSVIKRTKWAHVL